MGRGWCVIPIRNCDKNSVLESHKRAAVVERRNCNKYVVRVNWKANVNGSFRIQTAGSERQLSLASSLWRQSEPVRDIVKQAERCKRSEPMKPR